MTHSQTIRSLGLGLALSLSVFSACRKKPETPPEPSKTEVKPSVEANKAAVAAETGTLNQEYKALMDGVADYRGHCATYKFPHDDGEVAFNEIMDHISNLTYEDTAGLVQAKRFSAFQKKVEESIDIVVNTANSIVAPNADASPGASPTPTPTPTPTPASSEPSVASSGTNPESAQPNATPSATVTAEGTDTSTASQVATAEPASTKSGLLQGTAINAMVFGTLGLLSAGGIGYLAYKATGIRPDLRNLPIRDKVTKGMAITSVAIGVLASYALIVGAIIVSEKNPDHASIAAMQVSLGTGVAFTGIAALALGGLAVLPTKYYTQKEFYEKIKFKSMPANPPLMADPVKGASEADVAKAQALEDSKAGKLKIGFAASALIFAGVSAGLAYWTASLNLADTMSCKEQVLSKIGRAFTAMQEIEKRSP